MCLLFFLLYQSLLGIQVEQGLAKITQSRQQRRQRFGDVDAKSTSRFGKTCSPFQALSLLVSQSFDKNYVLLDHYHFKEVE